MTNEKVRKFPPSAKTLQFLAAIAGMILLSLLLLARHKLTYGILDERYCHPAFLVCLLSIIPIAIMYTFDGSLVLGTINGFLMQIGFSVQTMHAHSHVENRAALYAVATGFAIAAMCLYSKMCKLKLTSKHRATALKIAAAGSLVQFALLVIFGIEINEAKAWIEVPGTAMTMQLTETVKISYAVLLAIVLSSKMSEAKKLLAAAASLIIHAIFFIAINELGTMVVLMLTTFLIAFFYIRNNKLLKRLFAVSAITAALGATAVFLLSTETIGSHFPNNLTIIAEKIVTRIRINAAPEAYPNDGGVQLLRSMQAIKLGGLVGSDSNLPIPVCESDMIFPFLVMRMGIIVGVILVAAYLIMTIESAKTIKSIGNPTRKVFCSFLAISLIVQAGLTIGGSTNFIPLIGITLPLVSRGGSSLIVTQIFAFILLYESTQNFEGKRRQIRQKMELRVEKVKIMIMKLLMTIFACSFIIYLFGISTPGDPMTARGISPQYDVYEGVIFSADEVQLTAHQEGSTAKQAELTYPKQYSELLGYNTTKMGKSGLRARLADYLYSADKVGEMGATVNLTVNHSLQLMLFEELKKLNADASAVVLENKEGAIRALVSTKMNLLFDYNRIDENYNDYAKVDAAFIPEWKIRRCPGSSFKIVSSIPIIEAELDEYIYNDKTGQISIGGNTIHNYKGAAHGKLNLTSALKRSSNVYFCHLYSEKMPPTALEDTAMKLKFNEPIELDFMTINSNFAISTNDKGDAAQVSFGQGRTLLTPMHMAAIMATISNDGEWIQPYIIENIKKEDKVLYKHKNKKNERAIKKATAKTLKAALRATAKHYEAAALYAKTGTAQTPNGSQAWFVSSNDEYTVVISASNIGTGSTLIEMSSTVFQALEQL